MPKTRHKTAHNQLTDQQRAHNRLEVLETTTRLRLDDLSREERRPDDQEMKHRRYRHAQQQAAWAERRRGRAWEGRRVSHGQAGQCLSRIRDRATRPDTT